MLEELIGKRVEVHFVEEKNGGPLPMIGTVVEVEGSLLLLKDVSIDIPGGWSVVAKKDQVINCLSCGFRNLAIL
jgi:hypothetical protein